MLIISILVILSVIAITVSVTSSLVEQKVVYIDLKKVIDSFQYKQDLESEFSVIKKERSVFLDSLEMEIQVLYKKIEKEQNKNSKQELISTYDDLVTRYKFLEERFDSEMITLAEEKNAQLYDRLDAYLKTFGDMHSYSIIFGAQGSGLIMYAQDYLEITPEVIDYINNKYEGK